MFLVLTAAQISQGTRIFFSISKAHLARVTLLTRFSGMGETLRKMMRQRCVYECLEAVSLWSESISFTQQGQQGPTIPPQLS